MARMKRPFSNSFLRRGWSPVLLALALLTAPPPPADAAAVYRWTDAQGMVHFSDRPDEMPKAERVEVRPPAASTMPAPRHEAEEDDAGAPLQPDAVAQAEVRKKNCAIARDTLAHNESIDRMYRLGPDGERVFLTDEEREAVMRRSRDDVVKWCD